MNKIISFLNVSNSLDNNIFIFNLSNILKQEHKVILINLDYDDRNNFVNQKNRKIVKVDNINLFNLYQTNKNLIILNYKFDSFEIDKDKITNLVLKQIKK
jgi:hypothetical protein